MKICKVENCDNKHWSNGYCNKHRQQLFRCGKILHRTPREKNEIIDCGDYCEVILYNRQCQEIARAKIDKDDLEKVKKYKWHLHTGYAANKSDKKTLFLHQLILGKKDGFDIDHINHNELDNRKQNLRHCTHQQNCMNTKAKGYFWNKKLNKWAAAIMINYKSIHLGYFINKQDAIKARRKAEQKYFSEFAFNY